MNKFYVKAGFSKLKDSELVVKASTIIESIKMNDNFPDPRPSIPMVTDGLEEFQNCLNALPSGNKSDTVLKNQSREKLLALLKRLGYHVNETAVDFVALFTSGFPVSDSAFRRTSDIPAVPKGLELSDSTHSGKMRLDFSRDPFL